MREIKFRAWDGEQMSSPVTLQRLVQGKALEDIDKYQWLQYTGLKDKNGVEIYEGDILKHYAAGYHIGNFAVQWDDKGFWDYGIDNETSEVIGNIYSNPELLKETN